MMKNGKKAASAVMIAACSALMLTACSGTSTISSLTASDETASIGDTSALKTDSVLTGSIIPEENESMVIDENLVNGNADTGASGSGTSVSGGTDQSAAASAKGSGMASESAAESAANQIDEEQTDSGAPAGEGNTATAIADRINLRQAPDMSADNVITQIPEGAQVTVIRADGEWWQVSYEGKTGYVKAEYFE